MMKRTYSAWLLAALILSGCAEGYEYGVAVDIRNAPPPRFVFHERPTYVAEVSGGVYVVDPGENDCDMFQYGSYWYAFTGDYWYRATSYNGPYVAITYESVPTRVVNVPEEHWRHHPHGGPPGQMRKRGRDWNS